MTLPLLPPAARRRSLVPGLLLVAPLLLAGPSALAQLAWKAEPRAATGAVYESNPRLARGGQLDDDATGAVVEAELRLSGDTQRTSLLLRPRLRSSFYTNSRNDDLEDNDWFLDFSASHQLQRAGLGMTAAYRNVGVRSSEFSSAIPDDPDAPPPSGDSGDVDVVDDTREEWSVNPYASFVLTERNRLDLFAGYTDVSFDRTGTTSSRGDYDYLSGGARFEHAIDPRNRATLTANANRFEASQAGRIIENTSDSYSLTAGYERALTETWLLSGSLGASWTDTEALIEQVIPPGFEPLCGILLDCDPFTITDDATNFVGDLQLRRRGEINNLTLGISRAVSPSASGTEVVRDTYRVFFDRQLTALMTASVGFLLFDEESVNEQSSRDRTYFRGEAILRWRLTREWFLRGSYAYTRDDDDARTSNQTTDNNRVFIGVEWRGLGWRW